MHELSIAKALLQLADLHCPPGHHVRQVSVQVGPLQAIEPPAMQWAWQAAREGTSCANAVLDLQELPWALRCKDCARQWQSAVLDERCACTSENVCIVGGDQLQLASLDVVPAEQPAAPPRVTQANFFSN